MKFKNKLKYAKDKKVFVLPDSVVGSRKSDHLSRKERVKVSAGRRCVHSFQL